jgi:hypothetical protein
LENVNEILDCFTLTGSQCQHSWIASAYHVALFDEKPTIVWEFNSHLLAIQMMFSFMLTDGSKPLRMCKHCKNTFAATHHNAVFCGGRCKNQFNVYKRGK